FASGWRSLQRRTTYDAILISIAILAAYFYSIGATFLFKGTSLYITVGTVLSLVLFGHWLEMRIRLRATGTPQFTTRARKSRTDTALAGVARIIEEARQSRANVQYAIDAMVPYIPPLAIIAGIIAFFFWGLIAQKGSLFALLAGMATIIIARPDTLALAATTAVMVGIGVGARRGILIKSATAMERATRLDVILFDRVGVLTEGKLAVSDIVHVGKLTELGFLRLAAGLEKVAEHTYSRAIVEVAEGKVGMGLPAPSEFRVMPGYGTVGRVETRSIIVGNKRLMIDSEIDIRPVEEKASTLADQGKMVIYVAVGDRIEGILGIADSVRPGSKEAVRKLRKAGVSVALLTEEDTDTANAAAHELGIDKVYAEVLPAGKAERIKYLQRKGKCVGMVGDGEHDAIALTQADLGIAIGVGQNAPAKSGEIVLNSSDPLDVVDAIMLSRQVTRKIRQNIIWGVTYNSVAVILAMGILYPPLGIMVRPEIAAIVAPASMIATTLNSSFLKYRTNRSRI
ncbi:MAG TPA: HAD-IC family P-type ATPase, partial [Anaerolineae bacterium]|nr:HAD-IC family P-type ATPase [Anaerolineae bacterium]